MQDKIRLNNIHQLIMGHEPNIARCPPYPKCAAQVLHQGTLATKGEYYRTGHTPYMPAIFFLPFPTRACFCPLSPNNLEYLLACLSIWPILCTQFMVMARVMVGSGGSDILCC